MNSGQNNVRTTKKSGSGFSLWSRKSLKRSNTAHSVSPVTNSNDVTARIEHAASDDHLNTPHNGFQRQNSFQSSILSHPRRDMSPSAGEPGTWTTVPVAAAQVHYIIHNPLGPRWYKNYHLIPPSENRPGARPPTFFSPSFPGISTSNVAHPGDSENSSRAASKSPLPTPASSQTRVNEGVKPRSRKTSQTAPDNVDLLDVTDPWGTNWHHESPYDVGQAAIGPDGQGPRVRRASMTAAQNTLIKALNPSQLSQSTSAVHLHSLGQPSLPPTKPTSQTIQLPRKLSKRRPGTEGLFSPPTRDEERKAISAPPTPVERIHLADSPPPDPGSLPKRMSVAPPVTPVFNFTPQTFQTPPTLKKEKRSSMLGRLAKKFSLLAKSPSDEYDQSREYSWLHVNAPDAAPPMLQHPIMPQHGQHSSERSSVKRVPPPSILPAPEPVTPPKKDTARSRRSYTSIDERFMIGNLTVANPDSPDSDKGAPNKSPETISQPIPLHFDSAPAVMTIESKAQPSLPEPSIASSRSPSPFEGGTYAAYEKPLPIPVPSAVNTPHVDPKDISPDGSDVSSNAEEPETDVARSKTISSTATRNTIKPSAKPDPPPPASEVGEETNRSALSNHATVDELSTLSPNVPPTDVEKTPLPVTSPSLPPIPISTPFANTISLRPTSQFSTTPEPPPKVPPTSTTCSSRTDKEQCRHDEQCIPHTHAHVA
ncbi:hypothetical protein BKA70DRAFT_1417705 [Coprinopsis sp. MPI-PUGE-AT-0042]|nr:hypothetical protein BKA70DRAFT_1417705 [Coprinopsis sp. MPI-PUGE-AT-0042]